MAFKKIQQAISVPDSPEKLFFDLPRRKIPGVLPHQQEVMRSYAMAALDLPDVALQLPTGSGKTLVGLLIGEWRRRRNREKVVYLCPTRQLVNQVVEQAEEKYGLKVLGFTGSTSAYSPDAKAEYLSGDRIAVTTYSSLFNTNPFFNNADVLIIDDAHAAEGYISSLWSVRIERTNSEHVALHNTLCSILKPRLSLVNYRCLTGQNEGLASTWVEKIPTPVLAEIKDQIIDVIDAHATDCKLSYQWSLIRDHLFACHLYFSSQEILIRPIIPPTWTHEPFIRPKQRIYMSATLGSGGDLERLMGRKTIFRLPAPEGWNHQGVGRRFFIFPELSFREDDVLRLRHRLMEIAGRSLVLVPSDRIGLDVSSDVGKNLGYDVFDAAKIEISKKPFIEKNKAVAVVSNRYDGIDFPGEECRLMFIEGLPRVANIQERFIMSRMGAGLLFNERIQARTLQAIGRCTRSLEDYSAVVVTGAELPDYLIDQRRQKFLHPELQAEIAFGINQSRGVSIDDVVENFEIFLENGSQWEEANDQIVELKKGIAQDVFPAMHDLEDAVSDEICFQERLWQGDYEAALDSAEKVVAKLTTPELRGYRALWNYLAGSAAWLGASCPGLMRLSSKAQAHFSNAKGQAQGISWLVELARLQITSEQVDEVDPTLAHQIERLENVLMKFGPVNEAAFARQEKYVLDGLKNASQFEQAHKALGEFLGFDTYKEETSGSPDPWWVVDDQYFVFEDHAAASPGSMLTVAKARQAASHPKWIKQRHSLGPEDFILPILITPVTKVDKGAMPHLVDVSVWALDDFQNWALNAMGVVRELRAIFSESGDLEWRGKAEQLFRENVLDAKGMISMLKEKTAEKVLISAD